MSDRNEIPGPPGWKGAFVFENGREQMMKRFPGRPGNRITLYFKISADSVWERPRLVTSELHVGTRRSTLRRIRLAMSKQPETPGYPGRLVAF